ncbi:MAG: Rne/Rng family ribonuclease, partial [Pseudomonadota bacterium]
MSKKMLIDARHPEETRVALLAHGKVEDFDFESAARKPLRGNIYLARVTRVEPSLQAAFVEYGGNRHGFLAFSEIHSDYYQIPVADRDVLRKAEALEAELAEKLAELDESRAPLAEEEEERFDEVASENEDDDEAMASSDTGNDDEETDRPRRRRRRRGGRGRYNRSRGHKSSSEETSSDENLTTSEEGAEEPPAHPEEKVKANSEEDAGRSGNAADCKSIDGEDAVDEQASSPSLPLEAEAAPTLTQEVKEEPDLEGEDQKAEAQDDKTAEDDAPEENINEDEALETDSIAEDEGAVDEPESDTSGENAQETEEATQAKADEPPRELTEEEKAAQAAAAEIADLEKRYHEARQARDKLLRNYRIQEVINRRQIMLIQVVKEERGNKGAAVTSYLSLAGRYGVLMPNNSRGGGVSRKITNSSDRKRLRKAIKDLNVPQGQGLIIRTAGAKRTKVEIKRDYDYLSRLWDTIREQTLKSIAPCLIYEEASLIKRAMRDLYDKDTSEVLVEGEDGYREAKDFMKMLMPSHAKNVQPYREPIPLFLKRDVERQLDEMYRPVVTLKSGGYLVIQQTEALISIDVNSGKATKERNVEATALKTNSEAAVEVARQCRLRDLAGLVVIDFIDMDENRNNRAVEKKLKDAMKADRARIQIGAISSFGLLEMSRQRRRSGIVDGTTRVCPTCEGSGAIRSVEMGALRILRGIEEVAIKDRAAVVTAHTSHDVALYILNQKRSWINRIEETYKTSVEVLADTSKAGDQFELTKSGKAPEIPTLRQDTITSPEEEEDQKASSLEKDKQSPSAHDPSEGDEAESKPKKKSRRRRRKKSDDQTDHEAETAEASSKEEPSDASPETKDQQSSSEKPSSEEGGEEDSEGDGKKRRRRGRRGGRRNRKSSDASSSENSSDTQDGESSKKEPPKESVWADAPSPSAAFADPSATPQDAKPSPEAPAKKAEQSSPAQNPFRGSEASETPDASSTAGSDKNAAAPSAETSHSAPVKSKPTAPKRG